MENHNYFPFSQFSTIYYDLFKKLTIIIFNLLNYLTLIELITQPYQQLTRHSFHAFCLDWTKGG